MSEDATPDAHKRQKQKSDGPVTGDRDDITRRPTNRADLIAILLADLPPIEAGFSAKRRRLWLAACGVAIEYVYGPDP